MQRSFGLVLLEIPQANICLACFPSNFEHLGDGRLCPSAFLLLLHGIFQSSVQILTDWLMGNEWRHSGKHLNYALNFNHVLKTFLNNRLFRSQWRQKIALRFQVAQYAINGISSFICAFQGCILRLYFCLLFAQLKIHATKHRHSLKALDCAQEADSVTHGERSLWQVNQSHQRLEIFHHLPAQHLWPGEPRTWSTTAVTS